jgi:hypothetical protein
MHGSATTTPATRAAIQTSSLSIRALAHKYGINPKTVIKWKSRSTTDEMPMGPHKPRAKNLSIEEEGTCIGFRTQTMLPLDDCLYALQLMLPHLTRSNLHRLYQQHGISRLPVITEIETGIQDNFEEAIIGHLYVNAADIRTGDGKATMVFAFDQVSKFAFARLYKNADADTAQTFLQTLVSHVPYTIRRVLSDENPVSFDRACQQYDISHQALPKDQPWCLRPADGTQSNSADRPERNYHYKSHKHLQEHFFAFLDTYNFDRRLKTLGGLTPYEFVCECWKIQPQLFTLNPLKNRPELRTSSGC